MLRNVTAAGFAVCHGQITPRALNRTPRLKRIGRDTRFTLRLKSYGARLHRGGKVMKLALCRSVDEVQAALDGWGIPVAARTFAFVAPPARPRTSSRTNAARVRGRKTVAKPKARRKLKVRARRRA